MNARCAAIGLSVVLMSLHVGELPGAADGLPSVRVVAADASVFERADARSAVIAVVHAGAIVDLIDKGEGWYWILLARDRNGTRQPGWIQTDHVEVATAPTTRGALRTLHEDLTAQSATVEHRRIDDRKATQAEARKTAESARAQARLEEAARKVEAARRAYDALTGKAADAAVVR